MREKLKGAIVDSETAHGGSGSNRRAAILARRARRLLASTLRVDTYRAAVGRAAELAGGVRTLSQRLRVPVVDLMQWIQGEARPSRGMFLRIVDFIAEEGRRSRLPLAQERRKPGKPAK